ncbi:hypothetical protein OIU85_002070, partial [Salix viminalis]
LSDARILFDEIPYRNIVAWTSLITGNVQNDDAHEALMVFKEFLLKRVKKMVRRLKLLVDSVAMVSFLSACSRVSNKAVSVGVHGVVMKVFDEMAEKNVVSWNSMSAVYAQNGLSMDAFEQPETPSSSNHPVAAEEVDADGESSSTIANCVDRGN